MRKSVRILWIFSLCGLLAGCTSRTEASKPTNFIPPKTMQNMLVDIYQLEAELHVLESHNIDNVNVYGRQRLDSLLLAYGYSWDDWKTNFAYYMTDQKRTEALMEQVANRLTEMESIREKNLEDLETQELEVSEGFIQGTLYE